jgi:nicotinate-nucleotide adenylyltransferase
MSRRVGILGGTFDPIHCGHLDLGAAVQHALELTSLLVMPAQLPPHRPRPRASTFHRFAMVSLAVAGRPGWQASDLELGHDTTSYTSTTLQHLHDSGFHPAELFFVIGADAFVEIRSWKDYPRVLDGAHFAVVSRPGHPVTDLPERLPELESRMTNAPSGGASTAVSIFLIHAPTADVSATAIRQRRHAGQSITGLVSAAVEQHIEQHGLYSSITPDQREHGQVTNQAAGRLHGQS